MLKTTDVQPSEKRSQGKKTDPQQPERGPPGQPLPQGSGPIHRGRGDRIIPPIHTRVLAEHWGHPQLHWFPGGHVTHFGRDGYMRVIMNFLRRTLGR